MFNLFSSKGTLGIDIGTASIKIIELERHGGRYSLGNYGLFSIKNSGNQNETEQSILKLADEEIAGAIKETLKRSKIKSREAVASIPSFSTFATVIEMPYLSESELA